MNREHWLHEAAHSGLNRDLLNARRVASPNVSERPPGMQIDLLVIHNISLPPGQFGGRWIDDLFCNQLDPARHPYFRDIADLQVSAHALIDRHGQLTQYVAFDKKAWHAGQSCFDGRQQCNDFSIGIELEGTDTQPYTDEQYYALKRLTQVIRARHTLKAVRGHEHIAPGRKTDPGRAFKWRRYAREGQWLLRHLPQA